jgi:hypothetical protein
MPLYCSKRIKYFFIAGWFVASGTGCKKLVQVGPPENLLVAGAVFSNDSTARAAVTGLYIKAMGNNRYLLNGGMTLYPALSADELVRSSPAIAEDQFSYNSLLSNNLLVNANLWKAAYAYIYHCNICIEGLQKSTAVDAGLKERLTGEVQFVRALCYFYLVNLYGDVPLVLSTNANANALLPRSLVSIVYQQIIADLQSAITLLTDDVANTWPSRLAATALLARVYLQIQDWSNAEATASLVINSGKFALVTDLGLVFKSNSSETIFQWAPVLANFNAAEGMIFIPASPGAIPGYIITASLLSAFEPDDLRKIKWIKSNKVGNQTYYYPGKYSVRVSASPTEYNIVLRLAEQYLIRAGARAQQGKIAGAVADINTIRMRAGLPVISSSITSVQCLAAIEQERRTELFTEWGHRWFDLKRTSRADAVLSVVKGSNWQSTDHLYPIPLTELEADPNLTQNPGYE